MVDADRMRIILSCCLAFYDCDCTTVATFAKDIYPTLDTCALEPWTARARNQGLCACVHVVACVRECGRVSGAVLCARMSSHRTCCEARRVYH